MISRNLQVVLDCLDGVYRYSHFGLSSLVSGMNKTVSRCNCMKYDAVMAVNNQIWSSGYDAMLLSR